MQGTREGAKFTKKQKKYFPLIQMLSTETFIDAVFRHYTDSYDFNGLQISHFKELQNINTETLRSWLANLILAKKITLRYGEHGNPFIKSVPYPDVDTFTKLNFLAQSDLSFVVAYPSPELLLERVDQSLYSGRPFSLRLALGESQLDFHSFDLSVLEYYRNDPRYYYKVDDTFGSICVKSEHEKAADVYERDKIYLQTFGFSYDDAFNRSVAVFTRYLHDLSPEHQQLWEAKRLATRGKIHPDYYQASIQGEPSKYIPILTAFACELKHINEMSKLMGRAPLFRNTFLDEEKPRGFTLLIRPTSKEFFDFVSLLDKAMSDNINQDFFEKDIKMEEEIERGDGKIEVRRRGTIALLHEWLHMHFKPNDTLPLDEMAASFRSVRKLRQTPAHKTFEDEFDQKYCIQQRQLVLKAYEAVRLLRLLLQNHPSCHNYKVEQFLHEGLIRDF